jgi:hypothetical protein
MRSGVDRHLETTRHPFLLDFVPVVFSGDRVNQKSGVDAVPTRTRNAFLLRWCKEGSPRLEHG